MKMWSTRGAAVLMVAALILGLTACGSKGREVHKVNWMTAPAYTAEDIALPVETGDLLGSCTDGEYMYILADTKESEEVTTHLLRVSLADGGAVELDGFEATVVPDGGSKHTIGPFMASDGALWLYEVWTINYYDLPEDFDPETETVGKYLDRTEYFHHLRQLDPGTGRQKKILDLSDAVRTLEMENLLDISGAAVDGAGSVYFAGTGGVAVLDKGGNYLFTLEADLPRASYSGTSGGTLAMLPDGSMAALTILPGGKRAVRTIDAEAKTWGAAQYELPVGVDLIYAGTNGFLFYYVSGGALWGWEPESEEGRMLLNWSAADLSGAVSCFAPRDEGRLAVLTLTQNGSFKDEDYWYNNSLRLAVLSPADKAPQENRIKLVYGAIGTNSILRKRISQFNRINRQYYIELRNYAGEGVETFDADWEAAGKLLSAEIASGRVPDIWDTSLPISLYARKGLLEDLWPYIDNDPDISRDTLMSHVLDCASVDGKLYSVFSTFSISTAAARSEVVGDRTSWTPEEVLDFYGDMPEGSTILGEYHGKTGTLNSLLSYNYSQWIDWTTGECRFDSEDFTTLLELCSRVEDKLSGTVGQEEWNALANGSDLRAGRQLMQAVTLEGVEDILCCEALTGGPQCLVDYETYLNENNIFATRIDENGDWRDDSVLTCHALSLVNQARSSGKVLGWQTLSPDAAFGAVEGSHTAYVGFPSGDGAGSSFVLPSRYDRIASQLGISAACQNKEGAWAYVRQCLLPGGAGPVETDESTYLGSGFPINRADFELLFEPQWFQSADGEYVLDRDGSRIEAPQDITWVPKHYMDTDVIMVLFLLTPGEEQMERFWDLYNAIGGVKSDDSEVWTIIREQAEAYFAGDKSLEETVDLIQRRVTLCVNERR